MSNVIQLILEFLKLIYFLSNLYLKWSKEEQERFSERIKICTDWLKKATENKADIINEADFINNLAWEKQQRYKTYNTEIIAILNKGLGIEELKKSIIMGMGAKILKYQDFVLDILKQGYTINEKAILIAKKLIEDMV